MSAKIKVSALLLYDHQSKILLKRNKNGYQIPSTGIDYGLPAIESLKQFLHNEFDIKLKGRYFVGTIEEIIDDQNVYNLVFKVESDFHNIPSDEKYEWVELPFHPTIKIEPDYLKEDLARWLKGKAIFLSTKDKAYSQ